MSAKLVPTFADGGGCRVVSAAELYGRNLDFPDHVTIEKKVNLNIWNT
jgi:hypothetical protein